VIVVAGGIAVDGDILLADVAVLLMPFVDAYTLLAVVVAVAEPSFERGRAKPRSAESTWESAGS